MIFIFFLLVCTVGFVVNEGLPILAPILVVVVVLEVMFVFSFDVVDLSLSSFFTVVEGFIR